MDSVRTMLSQVAPGSTARVMELDTRDHIRLQKLLSLGVLPGVTVEVVQRFPCLVLSIDQALVAMDAGMAEAVLVERTGTVTGP